MAVAFRIVTLFPEIFSGFLSASLIGKAMDKGLLSVRTVQLRDYTEDRHRTVDDTPYGGGAGMVMKPEPVLAALRDHAECHSILLTPGGRVFRQEDARRLAAMDKPVLLFCGRYEGVDARAEERFDERLSIGDYVLNGGEVAAMAVIEAVARLVPGVLGARESVVEESFSNGLLEYPQYTRPEVIDGQAVPDVLLSGHHAAIAAWRRQQALVRTARFRPDLLATADVTEEERRWLRAALGDT